MVRPSEQPIQRALSENRIREQRVLILRRAVGLQRGSQRTKTILDGAAATLAEFEAIGVQLKLLSGDDPRAVAAVGQQAGIAFDTVISGSDLLRLAPDEVSELAAGGAVFGRLSPDQKEMLIRSLRAHGH